MSIVPEAAVFIATSLDGFIAREDGGLDWLSGYHADSDYGYRDFMASIDAIVMGRHTFEKVLSFGAWPYEGTPVIVLSSTNPALPDSLRSGVEVLALEPAAVLDRLGASGAKRVYVDGGDTIRRFLRAGLIRELIITRVPILIGRGIPLFGDIPADIPLAHVETVAFPDGLVQSRYRVAPADVRSQPN